MSNFFFFIPTVQSIPPSAVNLAYNIGTENLNITIVHKTENPNTHYINRVVIYKNNILNTTLNYTSQPTDETWTISVNISAVVGDKLKANAICNIFGSKEVELTVQNGTSSSITTGPGIRGYEMEIIFIAFCILIPLFILQKRTKKRNNDLN